MSQGNHLTNPIQDGIEYRLRNLQATCPCDPDFDKDCTHGVNNDPCLKGLRYAANRIEALVTERDAALAKVEQAFRDGTAVRCPESRREEDASWTRYQQEQTHG